MIGRIPDRSWRGETAVNRMGDVGIWSWKRVSVRMFSAELIAKKSSLHLTMECQQRQSREWPLSFSLFLTMPSWKPLQKSQTHSALLAHKVCLRPLQEDNLLKSKVLVSLATSYLESLRWEYAERRAWSMRTIQMLLYWLVKLHLCRLRDQS